jgi:folate-binding protein YgfZ
MTQAFVTSLPDRGVVRVTGADAEKFLQGLVTNDMGLLKEDAAIHAALLSPQGKILFDFLITPENGGYLLDVARDKAAGLVKRLAMYKLRAGVSIADASAQYVVMALWGENVQSPGETKGTRAFADPRHPELGRRILAEAAFARDVASASNGTNATPASYHAHRIALGVSEGGKDYDFGDAYPHEADFDLLHGVSFVKGCYVGQEIVARMQHKTVIRKRVVPVEGSAPLPSDRPDITAGTVSIGKLGSVSGTKGLAMLRLDRADEFEAQGVPLTAGGIALERVEAPWLPTLEADAPPAD